MAIFQYSAPQFHYITIAYSALCSQGFNVGLLSLECIRYSINNVQEEQIKIKMLNINILSILYSVEKFTGKQNEIVIYLEKIFYIFSLKFFSTLLIKIFPFADKYPILFFTLKTPDCNLQTISVD